MKIFRKLYNLPLILLFLASVSITGCGKDDISSVIDDSQPESPSITAEDVMKSLEEETLSADSKIPIYFRYKELEYSADETYNDSHGVDIISPGQFVKFTDFTGDSVNIETWADNIEINTDNSVTPTLTFGQLNPLLPCQMKSVHVRLGVTYTSFGLRMDGNYSSGDTDIVITVFLQNALDQYTDFDPEGDHSLLIEIKYEPKINIHWRGLSLNSNIEYASFDVTSSPIMFKTTAGENQNIFKKIQLALNTPCLQLSDYGFGSENRNMVSVADMVRILCFSNYFSNGIMSPQYPIRNIYSGSLYIKRGDGFPPGTFFYSAGSEEEARLFVNISRLIQFRILSKYNHTHGDTSHTVFPTDRSLMSDFIISLARILQSNSSDGIPVSFENTGEITNVIIDDSDLSRKIAAWLTGPLSDTDNQRRLNEIWKQKYDASEKEIADLNEAISSFSTMAPEYKIGFSYITSYNETQFVREAKNLFYPIWYPDYKNNDEEEEE